VGRKGKIGKKKKQRPKKKILKNSDGKKDGSRLTGCREKKNERRKNHSFVVKSGRAQSRKGSERRQKIQKAVRVEGARRRKQLAKKGGRRSTSGTHDKEGIGGLGGKRARQRETSIIAGEKKEVKKKRADWHKNRGRSPIKKESSNSAAKKKAPDSAKTRKKNCSQPTVTTGSTKGERFERNYSLCPVSMRQEKVAIESPGGGGGGSKKRETEKMGWKKKNPGRQKCQNQAGGHQKANL